MLTLTEVILFLFQVWGILIRSTDLEALLVASCPMFSTWLCLAVQPARTPFDPSILVQLPIIPVSLTQVRLHFLYFSLTVIIIIILI